MKTPDETSGESIASYRGVNACKFSQKLSWECGITFKMLTKQIDNVVSVSDRLEVDGLVFYVTELKKNISCGVCYTEMSGDHISYILNNDEYKVYAFEMAGKPRDILAALLEGTPFTVGIVDSEKEVTLRVKGSSIN